MHPGGEVRESWLSRAWNAVKPPPPVPGDRKPLNRSQRRLILGTVLVLVPVGIAAAIWAYLGSAEDRAEEAYQQGMQMMAPGQYRDAIEQFTKAIEISPQLAQAYFQRGNAHEVLNEIDAALADYASAVAINPNLATVYVARANIYRARGDMQKAAADLTQSIRAAPSSDAYYQLGQIHQAAGDLRQAVDDYGQAISLRPEVPYIYSARASARAGLGDAAGAEEDRKTAADLEH
jgi:tetratricopeptide (TPR) repeat protein